MEALIKNNQVINIIVGHIDNSLPLEDIQPTLTSTQRVDGFTYDIQATKVVKIHNIVDIPLEELKTKEINIVTTNSTASDQVTYNEVTYNGGDSSASAINGAIELAQNLGEADVRLWDINNIIRTYTFEEATTIAAQIAKAYRDAKYNDYQKIEAINACTTIEELEAIGV